MMIVKADFRIYPKRTKYSESDLTRCFIPDDDFDDICRSFPACAKHKNSFERWTEAQRNAATDVKPYDFLEVYLPVDSDDVQGILSRLARLGFTPDESRSLELPSGMFRMSLVREYSESDWAGAEYLTFNPTAQIWYGEYFYRSEEGLLQLSGPKLKKVQSPIGADSCFILLKDHLRREAEEAGFIGLSFLETIVCEADEKTPLQKTQDEAVWEMHTGITLPETASTLRDSRGRPFTGDYEKGCFLDEGVYKPAELHYRRSDLQRVADFDVAKTFERFGNADHVCFSHLVVSNKFYQFCAARDLPMRWVPVQVDED